MQLSKSVIAMTHGEVTFQGCPDQVQPDHRVLDAYLRTA